MLAVMRPCDLFDVTDVPSAKIRDLGESLTSFFVTENIDTSCQIDVTAVEVSGAQVVVYTEVEESYAQDVSEENMAKKAINVEGWHLVLAVFSVLAGSYLFAWDSHKALLSEISGLRTDLREDKKSADDDLKKLIAELRTEREADRQQAKVDGVALREELTKVRETQSATLEALKNLNKPR